MPNPYGRLAAVGLETVTVIDSRGRKGYTRPGAARRSARERASAANASRSGNRPTINALSAAALCSMTSHGAVIAKP